MPFSMQYPTRSWHILWVRLLLIYFVSSCKTLTIPTGWAVPWGYAIIMAVVTVFTCKKMLKDERADEKAQVLGETGI